MTITNSLQTLIMYAIRDMKIKAIGNPKYSASGGRDRYFIDIISVTER